MKPTQYILILLSLFLIFSCEDNSVEPLVCDEGYSDVDGECTFICPQDSVQLWNVNYNIETTTVIDLGYSEVIGEIHPDIGCLVNLNELLCSFVG